MNSKERRPGGQVHLLCLETICRAFKGLHSGASFSRLQSFLLEFFRNLFKGEVLTRNFSRVVFYNFLYGSTNISLTINLKVQFIIFSLHFLIKICDRISVVDDNDSIIPDIISILGHYLTELLFCFIEGFWHVLHWNFRSFRYDTLFQWSNSFWDTSSSVVQIFDFALKLTDIQMSLCHVGLKNFNHFRTDFNQASLSRCGSFKCADSLPFLLELYLKFLNRVRIRIYKSTLGRIISLKLLNFFLFQLNRALSNCNRCPILVHSEFNLVHVSLRCFSWNWCLESDSSCIKCGYRSYGSQSLLNRLEVGYFRISRSGLNFQVVYAILDVKHGGGVSPWNLDFSLVEINFEWVDSIKWRGLVLFQAL